MFLCVAVGPRGFERKGRCFCCSSRAKVLFVAGVSRRVSLEGEPSVGCLTSIFQAMHPCRFANSVINLKKSFAI